LPAYDFSFEHEEQQQPTGDTFRGPFIPYLETIPPSSSSMMSVFSFSPGRSTKPGDGALGKGP
jgi:hypothetical protein